MDLTWPQIEKINTLVCSHIATLLGEKLPGATIAVIPRGGLVPASLIMYKLGLEKTNVFVSNPPWSGSPLLIVDGIADTGETMERERRLAVEDKKTRLVFGAAERVFTVSFVMRHSCKYPPHIYGLRYPKDDYINFPWEGE